MKKTPTLPITSNLFSDSGKKMPTTAQEFNQAAKEQGIGNHELKAQDLKAEYEADRRALAERKKLLAAKQNSATPSSSVLGGLLNDPIAAARQQRSAATQKTSSTDLLSPTSPTLVKVR